MQSVPGVSRHRPYFIFKVINDQEELNPRLDRCANMCAVGVPRTSDYGPAQDDLVYPSPFLSYLGPEPAILDTSS